MRTFEDVSKQVMRIMLWIGKEGGSSEQKKECSDELLVRVSSLYARICSDHGIPCANLEPPPLSGATELSADAVILLEELEQHFAQKGFSVVRPVQKDP